MDWTKKFNSHISGRIGTLAKFGHNQFGTWVSTNEYFFPPQPWRGDMASMMWDDLHPVWLSLTLEEKQTWIPRANRLRASIFCAWTQINIRNWYKGLDPVRVDN